MTAITTIRATFGDVTEAAEAHTTVATMAGYNLNLDPINKHLNSPSWG
jgi:hypothetical protein